MHSVMVLRSFRAKVGIGSASVNINPYFGNSCFNISSFIVFEATEDAFLGSYILFMSKIKVLFVAHVLGEGVASEFEAGTSEFFIFAVDLG